MKLDWKRNRFLLLSLLAVLVVLGGGIYKHTALKDHREELTYQYKVMYTVEVRDVDGLYLDMYYPGMGLYLDESTAAGSVQQVDSAPAASGEEGKYDLTLRVSASGSRLTAGGYGDYTLTENNSCTFVSRFLTFEGYITEVNEV